MRRETTGKNYQSHFRRLQGWRTGENESDKILQEKAMMEHGKGIYANAKKGVLLNCTCAHFHFRTQRGPGIHELVDRVFILHARSSILRTPLDRAEAGANLNAAHQGVQRSLAQVPARLTQ